MQRVPDDLVSLAVQHGLGQPDGDGWGASTEDLQRLAVIATPAPARTRTAVSAPTQARTRPRLSHAQTKARAEGVARDDRRARLAQDVRVQREQVAAVRVALEALYDAQGAYIQTLDDVRATDAQVASAHRLVLAAHDALARMQGRGR